MPHWPTLVAELRQLLGVDESPNLEMLARHVEADLNELEDLLEKSPMDPFKRRARLGSGPYGRKVAKRPKDRFRCNCTARGTGSVCKCKSRSRLKTVFVSYDYKNAYNDVYRSWLRKRKTGRLRAKKKQQDFQTKAEIG